MEISYILVSRDVFQTAYYSKTQKVHFYEKSGLFCFDLFS